jgi:16S rRNA G966 N2-methylase RsmD
MENSMTLLELEALQSEAARLFIVNRCKEDPGALALQESARRDIPIRACIEQIALQPKAMRKIPTLASQGYICHSTGLQQCSSERTARYRASIMQGKRLIDLTGGLGVDTFFLAESFIETVYCETDPMLCELFRVNKSEVAAHRSISIQNTDGLTYLENSPDNEFDWIYCDPCRRGETGREVDLYRCTPSIPEYEELLVSKGRQVCIKASPAYDITKAAAVFKHLREIRIVSVEGECKELLLFLARTTQHAPITITAVILSSTGVATIVNDNAGSRMSSPDRPSGSVLLIPDPAIVKANLIDAVAGQYGANRVGNGSSYLVSAEIPESFPGRIFDVITEMPWKRKTVLSYLKAKGITGAVCSRSDFPMRPEELRAMLGLKESATEFLFFSRNAAGELVCLHARRRDPIQV